MYKRQDENILVIGRLIKFHKMRPIDLSTVQVNISCEYYEYDGSLTTPPYSPVKWIVDRNSVCMNPREIIDIAKPVRELQELHGRIILYSQM